MRPTIPVLVLLALLALGMLRPATAAGMPQVSVRTDKAVYSAGEVVQIEVLLANVGDAPVTLHFATTCQATYDVVDPVGHIWYSASTHVFCGQALGDLTLAPGPGFAYPFAWNQVDDWGKPVPVPGDFTVRGRILSQEPVPPGVASISIRAGGPSPPTTPPITPPVTPAPPRASFTVSPTSGDVGTLFTADASASSNPGNPGGTLEVRWDWDGDGLWDTGWSTIRVAQHRYQSSGIFQIRLEVRNDAGLTDSATFTVRVTSSGPVVFGSNAPVALGSFPAEMALGISAAIALGLAGVLGVHRRNRAEA